MSTVSAIVVTRHPSERVVELLGSVRSVVDEVVAVVDDRAGEHGLGALEPLADTVALFHFEHAIERQWEWIASLAASDWILWLDDDELPSPALVASIRDLIEATDVTHYLVRRTWIWPDAACGLAEPPWAPDFSPRLYRASSALVWYPGILHVPVQQVGPFRFVDTPLYHVDLLRNSEESRRAKAVHYERLRPGLRVAGRPQNAAVYLPESRAEPPLTAVVPERDREVIERFLGRSEDPIADDASDAAGEAWGCGGDCSRLSGSLRPTVRDEAVLSFVGPIEPAYARVERSFEVRVENRGSDWWSPTGFGVSDVFVSYRWYTADGALVVDGGLRTPLPVAVPPGGSELVVVDLIPPDAPGTYILGVDLVREHVHWFGCDVRVNVEVRGLPRIGVLVDPNDSSTAVDVARTLTDATAGGNSHPPRTRPALDDRCPRLSGRFRPDGRATVAGICSGCCSTPFTAVDAAQQRERRHHSTSSSSRVRRDSQVWPGGERLWRSQRRSAPSCASALRSSPGGRCPRARAIPPAGSRAGCCRSSSAR